LFSPGSNQAPQADRPLRGKGAQFAGYLRTGRQGIEGGFRPNPTELFELSGPQGGGDQARRTATPIRLSTGRASYSQTKTKVIPNRAPTAGSCPSGSRQAAGPIRLPGRRAHCPPTKRRLTVNGNAGAELALPGVLCYRGSPGAPARPGLRVRLPSFACTRSRKLRRHDSQEIPVWIMRGRIPHFSGHEGEPN
jgi:hypothetical protein